MTDRLGVQRFSANVISRQYHVIVIVVLAALVLGSLTAWVGPKIFLVVPLVIGAGALVLLLKRPVRLLSVFILLLPWHFMLMVVLYGQVGLSRQTIRVAQLWKEGLMLIGLVAGIVLVMQQGLKRRLVGLKVLDLFVIGFGAINFIMTFWPNAETELVTRALAARSHSSFVMFYVLGRLLPLRERSQRSFVDVIMVLSMITTVGALVDFFLLPRFWPVDIGYVRYLQDLLGGAYSGGPMGLPWSFFTETGRFRRTSGLYANPLDMAASLHIMVGTLLSYVILVHGGWRRYAAGGLLLAIILVMASTIARMSFMVLVVTIIVIPWILERLRISVPIVLSALLGLLVLGLLVFLGMLVSSSSWLADFIVRTVSFEHSSSFGHLDTWREGIKALAEQPFGLGLGSSGSVAVQSSGGSIGGENLYITLGIDLSIPVALLYVMTLGIAYLNVVKLAILSKRPLLRIVACAAIGGLHGLILLGLTSQISIYLFINWITWWLVGSLITVTVKVRPSIMLSTHSGSQLGGEERSFRLLAQQDGDGQARNVGPSFFITK